VNFLNNLSGSEVGQMCMAGRWLDIDFFCFWNFEELIDLLFTVLRPAQEFFHLYMETSPLPVKGCKI
jgi:hypothetical protein